MASPSSASTRFDENDPEWTYAPRAAKRRKRASTVGTCKPSPREIGFMREPRDDESASFLGSSSGIHFIRHVYNAFARRSADLNQTRSRDRSSVPGEDDRLHRSPGGCHDSDDLWLKSELNLATNPTFSFEDLVKWTRSYFQNWHPIFPCLHAPTVLKVMERVSHREPGSVSRLDMMILRSMISISLGDSRQTAAPESKIGPIPATLVFRTVQQVMHEVQILLEERTTLPLLQAAFTAQLALTSLLRLNAASRVGGVITRTAFHLGLHRCPGRFSCFNDEEFDIRRRLFWSIYSVERYLSQALGMPLGIRDDDIDVCYPGIERHSTAASKHSDDQRLRLLCHFAKFARIRGLILELRNKSILHSHASSVEAAHVNSELSQWWNEVYDDVYPIDEHVDIGEEQGPPVQPYHRLVLIILRYEAIISMNRPLLAAERPSPEYKNALQTCIESSRSLLAALKQSMSSSSEAPLAWPSFTWATWMACLILMYASWEGEFVIPTALKYARMGIYILQNLALRGSSWPETCIEAIRGMESALLTYASHGQRSKIATTSEEGQSELQPSTGIPVDGNTTSANNLANHATNSQASVTHLTPARAEYLAANGSQDLSISTAAHPHATRGFESEISDSAIVSPHHDGGNNDLGPEHDGYLNAGLIFGNMADSNVPFYPGIAGQSSLPFSESPSLFMNDLWSVADGPWMIHGNFL
ncbi:transcriptional regulator family: Fungal Specific TF [Penicillium alfredii]|uniref:Transcriptional regulator family: Fungal Specific TF n=1 Tax=Penicillium alfredii TaxID=1506179 RepID=A0A9W9GB10_9EURO|nr:transcriptional regulator family: Fungal Specific TF [Penicillium alfredii]KAJ5115257.1 transcriptional regulator family: Fungal Specific TF [Penicillium alfredii]